jgi:hypothetical protein
VTSRSLTGPTHVRLELHADGEAFRGRAISDVESREFHGWVGLVGTLEAMIETAAAAQEAAAPGA